jgi:hypothetical protein
LRLSLSLPVGFLHYIGYGCDIGSSLSIGYVVIWVVISKAIRCKGNGDEQSKRWQGGAAAVPGLDEFIPIIGLVRCGFSRIGSMSSTSPE